MTALSQLDDQRMLSNGDAGLVRILDANGHQQGMGILVRPSMVVTCAHVVNLALGRPSESPQEPQAAELRATFPIVAGQHERRARIQKWSAPGVTPVDDICLLALNEPAPPEAGIAVLGDIRNIPMGKDRLSVFGNPRGSEIGRHVDVRFVGRANAAWVQIDSMSQTGAFIEPGYSGAAVWNQEHECVVGMVVARQEDAAIRMAYMLSAAQVLHFAEEVPGERRTLQAQFATIWTTYGSVLFIVLLCHFLATQYGLFPAVLSFGFGNKALAGFWGLHLAAFLLPYFFWMQISFACAFREHPWWMRVPAFGALGAPPQPTRRRGAAVLSLVLLSLWPLWELGHFARTLHTRGEVYIYRSALTEDYRRIEDIFPGTYCDMPHVDTHCTHPEARLYGLARTGIRNDQSYWLNMYHYGNRTAEPRASVTFFPILQPVILMIFTALCGFLGIAAIWKVLRPAKRTRDVF